MTPAQAANVVLRILGAVWVVRGLMALPQVAVLSIVQEGGSGRLLAIGSAVTSLLWVALGFALYSGSERVARRMFSNGEAVSPRGETDRILEVGLVLLAVYLGIDALGRIGGLLYTVSQYDSWQSESQLRFVWNAKREGLLAALVEIIACVALFFGRRGLARLARSVRSMPEGAA